jgi:hypothetical protein
MGDFLIRHGQAAFVGAKSEFEEPDVFLPVENLA